MYFTVPSNGQTRFDLAVTIFNGIPLLVGKSIKFEKQKYWADRINHSIQIGTNQFLSTVGFGTQHGLEAELINRFSS